MNRIYRKSPFWSVCGPFLIFMGIEMAVQTIVEMIVMIPYMAKLLAEEMRAGGQAVPAEETAAVLNQVLTVMAEQDVYKRQEKRRRYTRIGSIFSTFVYAPGSVRF